jgi:hypothetical protein
LERKLTLSEKTEVFQVFLKVGQRMQLTGLPETFEQWQIMRIQHLQQNLISSHFTVDLYQQYKKHLGAARFILVKKIQAILVPPQVKQLLCLKDAPMLMPVLSIFKVIRNTAFGRFLKNALLPATYKAQIRALDITP